MKLHDAEYSSNTSGNLSSRRLSGLAPNSELTENGRASGNKIFLRLSEKHQSFDSMVERASRDSSEYHRVGGDTIFSGLTEKYRASKKSPKNLHDLASTWISDLTGKLITAVVAAARVLQVRCWRVASLVHYRHRKSLSHTSWRRQRRMISCSQVRFWIPTHVSIPSPSPIVKKTICITSP